MSATPPDVPHLSIRARAEMALRQAAAQAAAEHKRLGHPLVIWRDGKVVLVPPEEIMVPEIPWLNGASTNGVPEVPPQESGK